jgi:VanZ family protein
MRALSRFGPPLLLMGVIFLLSAQPNLNSGLGTWDTILRKCAHMLEYGLLWLLWWRALGYGSKVPPALIAIAYAATDEFHQRFVAQRHGAPVDVLIDAAGVAIAIAAVSWRARRRRPSAAA